MPLRILYVENHEAFAQVVTSSFLGDHDVTVVPSLARARTAVFEDHYDVLIVDYDLDDGKGAELVRSFRSIGYAVPIVGASAHDDGNAALEAAGADAVCPKAKFEEIATVLADLGLV